MSGADPVKSFETLDVQVKALEGDVRDIKTSIASLGAEVRQALSNVTSQFAERQRTPWSPLIAGAGFLVTVLVLFGSQAMSPIQSDIRTLKDEVVPRVEHNYRQEATNRLFEDINKRLDLIQSRKYDDMNRQIERLESENSDLKRK